MPVLNTVKIIRNNMKVFINKADKTIKCVASWLTKVNSKPKLKYLPEQINNNTEKILQVKVYCCSGILPTNQSNLAASTKRVNIPQCLCYSVKIDSIGKTLIIYSQNPRVRLARQHMHEAHMVSGIQVWCLGYRSRHSNDLHSVHTTPVAALFLSHM